MCSKVGDMNSKSVIIGIAGGTGAGKTVLMQSIVEHLNSHDVVSIQYDSYYKDKKHLPPSERKIFNYDHPSALNTELLIQHLNELIVGNAVEIPVYDFATHCRSDNSLTIKPAKVIILDGILLLANAKLRKLIDIKIFMEVDNDIRFIRRLQRDLKERNRKVESVIKQYVETVKPMHMRFVEPSKKYADIIIPQGCNPVVVDMIVSLIDKYQKCKVNKRKI